MMKIHQMKVLPYGFGERKNRNDGEMQNMMWRDGPSIRQVFLAGSGQPGQGGFGDGGAHHVAKYRQGREAGHELLAARRALERHDAEADVNHQCDQLGHQPGLLARAHLQGHRQQHPEQQQEGVVDMGQDLQPLLLQAGTAPRASSQR